MKKILFISNCNALNTSYGAEQRGNALIKAFIANGYRVDYAYIGSREETLHQCMEGVKIVFWNKGKKWEISNKDKIQRLLTFKMFPTSLELSTIIDQLEQENNYDYIACRYLQIASLAGLYSYAKKLILDIDDLPAQSFKTHIGKCDLWHVIYHKLMYISMEYETKRWIKRSYVSFFPNNVQAKHYCGTYLPNIPVVSCTKPSFESNSHNILFIGRLDFDPNYNGLDTFITNCWNKIIENCPQAKLIIAGAGLKLDLYEKWTKFKNIEILGFVEDIISFYNKGNIIISPITVGAGTNIKVIEALSLGKACVLSKFSTKGFDDIIEEDINCTIYKDYDECVTKIINLLHTPSICERMGVKAFESTQKKYSQSVLNNIVSSILY